MRTTQNGLTRREREYLDHLRQAQGQQLMLAQYCRARGLRAQRLYSVSAKLVRKGYVEHRSRPVCDGSLLREDRVVSAGCAYVASISCTNYCKHGLSTPVSHE